MTTTAASSTRTRTRAIAFCALSIALMAVSAWYAVPIGPVPITLQIFVGAFILVALEPKLAMASIVGYIVLGAIGVPVFSGMRGGIGMLAGPTGGFLWGYIVGFVLALAIGSFIKDSSDAADGGRRFSRRELARSFIMAFIYLFCAYVCGWFQFMPVMGVGPEAAFASAVAPFIVVDIVKIAVAVPVALSVKHALGARS